MAFDYKRLILPTEINNEYNYTAVYTNPVGKRTYIKQIILQNTSQLTMKYIEIGLAPSSITIDDLTNGDVKTNLFYFGLDPLEGEVIDFPAPGLLLEDVGDYLWIYSEGDSEDTPHYLNIQIYGGIE